MVVPYSVEGDVFRPEKPRPWSPGRIVNRPRQRPWDLHPDGQRVAVAARADAGPATRQDKVVFIFNFFDELRRIAPAAR